MKSYPNDTVARHHPRRSRLFRALGARLFTAAFLVALPAVLLASDRDVQLEAASEAARQGRLADAERIYDAILKESPDDVDALLQRGIVRSWQGRREDARRDFRAVLASDPEHLGALIGLGYDFAWDGDYQDAAATFRLALTIAPDTLDAQKGLAYTYLWSGRTESALRMFERLQKRRPEDVEMAVAAGHTHLALGHQRRAREAFRSALAIDPSRADAKEGIGAVRDIRPPLDLNLWVGNSTNGGKSGLRQLEIASWPWRNVRVSARYDNSLSLDNPAADRDRWVLWSSIRGVLGTGRRLSPDRRDQDRRFHRCQLHGCHRRPCRSGGARQS